MKYKKIMIILITAIFLVSIAGVCAADNATGEIVSTEETQVMEQITAEEMVCEGNVEPLQELQNNTVNPDSMLKSDGNHEDGVAVENDDLDVQREFDDSSNPLSDGSSTGQSVGNIYGIVDLGSNVMSLSIFKEEDGGLELLLTDNRESITVTYKQDNALTQEGIYQLIMLLEDFDGIMDSNNVTFKYFFATSSLRKLDNCDEVVADVKNALGIDLHVLSGEDEARARFDAVKFLDLTSDDGLLIDVGGGSCEFVPFIGKSPVLTESMPIGSRSCYEDYVSSMFPNETEILNIQNRVEMELGKLRVNNSGPIDDLYGNGGTLFTVRQILIYLNYIDNETYVIPSSMLDALLSKLLENTTESYQIISDVAPDRMNTLVPGIVIAIQISNHFQVKNIHFCKGRLEEGIVYELIENHSSSNGTFEELRDKINTAVEGSIIYLNRNYINEGSFSSEGINITKAITIEGNGFTIDASGFSRIFNINTTKNVVLNNITFKNAHVLSGAAGGAIVFNNTSEVVVSNCIFENCNAYNAGAILFNNSGNCNVSDCAFLNNSADCDAGAIEFIRSDNCSVFNCAFLNNSAGFNGGAIYWSGINGYMANISIVNVSVNSAGSGKSSNGGAIFYGGSKGILINASISNTFAIGDGGAIYWSGNDGYMANISIFNASANSAGSGKSSNGGAIFYGGSGGTLINASISNTFAAGSGGAIYWKGSSPVVINNISIVHSRTCVIDSVNSADGGAIYATTITQLDNVYIRDAHSHKNQGKVYGGAIYWKDGKTLNNIIVISSGASTDDGTSYGGAIYSERKYGSTSVWVYNSTFERNNADLGGGLYLEKLTGYIYDSLFAENDANNDGGAVYVYNEGIYAYNSAFKYNSAKNGGAVFAQNAHIQIKNSTFEFNVAEEKGGAVYYNYIDKSGSSWIEYTDLTNNTAFQGSAIYGTKFNKLSLMNVVLLDNRANSNGFIEKFVGVDEAGHTYVGGVFVGFDNLLNAIWQEATSALSCFNVTYWGVEGKKTTNSPPVQNEYEANINVTVEIYDENGVKLSTANVVTDNNGEFKHTFDAEEGKTYHFAFVHDGDRYYGDLRDTLSNGSHVKIYVVDLVYYFQNHTFLIELTDGAGGIMNGTVSVTLNDSEHTTFTIDVINGTGVKSNFTYLPVGHYNATAFFAGDINHTGDTAWVLFEVLPYYDLQITNEVNVTFEVLNVKDIIRYTINVTNHGPGKAYGVNVTEVLSPSLKLIESNTTIGNYNSTGGYWYIGELDENHFETLTIIVEIVHMGEIDNTVWVTGWGMDANESNNFDSAHNFTAMPVVDLSVNKTSDKNEYCIGDIAVWTITVYNAGNSTNASNVYLYDYFPGDYFEIINITVDSGTWMEDIKNRYYLWDIGFMETGSNVTMVITSRVVLAREEILNFASIFSSEDEWDYENNVARKTVDVIKPNSTVNVTDAVIDYGKTLNINVTTHGAVGITAKINDTNATVKNNTIIISSLDVGTYTLTVTTMPDENHASVTKTVNVTVNKVNSTLTVDNIVFDYNDIGSSEVSFTDAIGINASVVNQPNAVVNVINNTITVSGLNAGTYTLTVTTIVDSNHINVTKNATVTVNKLKTVLTANAITSTYNFNKDLVIALKDAKGKALSGVKITVNLNGAKDYVTDKNGQVKVSTKGLAPKKYTAKITFSGNVNYGNSANDVKVTVKKAKPKLTAKKKMYKTKVKTKKYTITLKDNIGKAIRKAKVTLKVKGKIYKAKTNSKGKATFKITKLNKEGKFKAVIKYKGNKYYEKITKKVKIKVYSLHKS